MMDRSAFHPHKITVAVFFMLAVFMPVLYIYAEPERANYLPGEKQDWIVKTRRYESVFDEYFYHTEGSPDILLGIIVRDYFRNYIGILLLIIYYTFAIGFNLIIHRIRWKI